MKSRPDPFAPMIVEDLSTLSYGPAWDRQRRVHAAVADGAEERILLVEHPPVITFGRRSGVERHLLASQQQLAALGVEVVQSDRGGDITFHGPGQVVAYPIIRLNDHRLTIGGYVKRLEAAVVATLADFAIAARPRECGAVGVWVDEVDDQNEGRTRGQGDKGTRRLAPNSSSNLGAGGSPAKICALGVRIRRGVSMHGLALNVTTDLRYFNLIVPCGLSGRRVTSLSRLLGEDCPPIDAVKQTLTRRLIESLDLAATPEGACHV